MTIPKKAKSMLHPKISLMILITISFVFISACEEKSDLMKGELIESGIASWYGEGYEGLTANGETYNKDALTAAHKSLPFNTIVKVVNLDNGKSVTVRINDRGPFVEGRVIDLSKRAAQEIGIIEVGLARVDLYLILEG